MDQAHGSGHASGIRASIDLMRSTLSCLWTVSALWIGVSLLHLTSVILIDGAKMFPEFPILSCVALVACRIDLYVKQRTFGGEGFFDVLRRQHRHAFHAQEKTRTQGAQTCQDQRRDAEAWHRKPAPIPAPNPPLDRAAETDRILKRVFAQILTHTDEPRAQMIAKRTKKASDQIRMLPVIANNLRGEPKSARIAAAGMDALRTMR